MNKEFIKKLTQIQDEIYVPKGQWNEFGKYLYRDTDDILFALKPLLKSHSLMVMLNDEIIQVGDRHYIKSTATITDGESSIEASAFAREALTKKGMDEAQITGATSSYARKYALSGLLGLDDEVDPDDKKDTGEEKKDKFTKPREDVGNYVINYGKDIKGMTFNEAGKEKVKGLLDWFIKTNEEKKQTPSKDVQEFINKAREFIR